MPAINKAVNNPQLLAALDKVSAGARHDQAGRA